MERLGHAHLDAERLGKLGAAHQRPRHPRRHAVTPEPRPLVRLRAAGERVQALKRTKEILVTISISGTCLAEEEHLTVRNYIVRKANKATLDRWFNSPFNLSVN